MSSNNSEWNSSGQPHSNDGAHVPPQGSSAQADGWSEGPAAPPQGQPAQAASPRTNAAPPQGQPYAFQSQPHAPHAAYAPYTPYTPQAAYAAPMPPAPAPQKKSRGWIVALVAVILLFLLGMFSVTSCTSLFASSMGMTSSSSSSLDALTQDAVGVITISGTIQYDGTSASPEGLKSLLDEAEANPHIKAVVLRVDSGGGVSTAGEEMTEYLRDFSKPVVVSSASSNASAAYEISSQADYIFANSSSLVGSIGTAIQITDTSELMDKLGINIQDITSSDSKDSTYGTRPLTDDERAYYQSMVDQINEQFIQNVAEGRGMGVEEVRALANGLSYTGTDALENGLIDEIGTKEDAEAKAAELAGMTTYTVVPLELESSDISAMLDLLSESNAAADGVQSDSTASDAQAIKEFDDNGIAAQ